MGLLERIMLMSEDDEQRAILFRVVQWTSFLFLFLGALFIVFFMLREAM